MHFKTVIHAVRKKTKLFEAINQKSKFIEVLNSLNGGDWRDDGEEITLLRDKFPGQIVKRTQKVIS